MPKRDAHTMKTYQEQARYREAQAARADRIHLIAMSLLCAALTGLLLYVAYHTIDANLAAVEGILP